MNRVTHAAATVDWRMTVNWTTGGILLLDY
jgi:hypothetical protein